MHRLAHEIQIARNTKLENLMALSEWSLIFFDKVPGLNSWPMKDEFTFRVCQRNIET